MSYSRAGLGLVLEQKLDFGPVTIQSIVPGGPADRDGKLKRGDKIFSIDGGATFGSKLENVLSQLMGESGSSVTIVALRFVPGSLFSPGSDTKITATLWKQQLEACTDPSILPAALDASQVKELTGEIHLLSEFARSSGSDDSLQTRITATAAEPFASLRSLWRQVGVIKGREASSVRLLQLAKEELESRKEQIRNAALSLEQAKTAIMLLELDKKRVKEYSEGLEEQMQQLHKVHAEQELQMTRMQQELAKHAQTFVEEQLNMLESEMSAQEQAVTDKVTQHLQQQFQQEFEKFSQQHAADVAELKQAHEAEMAASHAREEANLTQVMRRYALEFESKNQEQEKLIESMRDQHARDMQAWQDRLQRELQAQDEAHKLSLMGYLPSQVAKEPLSQLGTAPQQRQQQQQQQQQQKRDSMGTVAPGQYVPASNPSAAAHNQQQSQLSFSEQQLRHSAGSGAGQGRGLMFSLQQQQQQQQQQQFSLHQQHERVQPPISVGSAMSDGEIRM